MLPSLALFCSLLLGGAPAVESICLQVGPVPANGKWTRSANQTKAVVLVHGFYYHFKDKSVPKAELRPWQKADSPLVKELAKTSDVYVFGYGQNGSVDAIANQSKLGDNIAQLKQLGYTEIILVGHSAGGLIARHFVEDHPDAGVTKVIQVCAPNGGSPLAVLPGLKSQQVFLACLTEKGRQQCMTDRAAKLVPKNVQFVCVVARENGAKGTDGVVPCVNQWTLDLQRQGVPAIGILATHREVVRDAKIAATLATLVHEPQPRWNIERIDRARKEIFGK